jgi:sporulation protein YlmC with PRC-barrel domain
LFYLWGFLRIAITYKDRKMKLTKDAKIITADGKSIGNLNRFVVDPRSKRISHIVFEEGMLFSKTEYVLPMELIDHIDDQGIHLIDLPFKVEELPAFEEERYVVTNEHALLNDSALSENTISSYYYYPPVPNASAGYQPPSRIDMFRPTAPSAPVIRRNLPTEGNDVPPVVKGKGQNIPDDFVALKEGAKVVSSDQKHVGDVEKVIMDPSSETATHLLITKGLLNKEKKLIPLEWVDQILEEEVSLALGEEVIDQLPEYHED